MFRHINSITHPPYAVPGETLGQLSLWRHAATGASHAQSAHELGIASYVPRVQTP